MYRTIGRVLLIAAAVLLLVVPIAAIGVGDFEDVPDDNVFKADIEWLASVGVTKGCNPPLNTKYCPGNNVTRGQMAAFMHRLADGVVDADTVQGLEPADLKDQAASGSWAITVSPDGWAPTGPDTNLYVFRGNGTKVFGALSAPWSAHLLMNPDLMTVVADAPLRLTAVEQCYDAKLATMTRFEVGIYRQNDVRDMGDLRHEFTYETDRTGSACDVLEISPPVVMTAEHGVSLTAIVEWANDRNEFDFGRTTFILERAPGADARIP